MSTGRALAAATLALLLGVAPALGARASDPGNASDRLRALGDEYLARRMALAPHLATRLGVHSSDERLLPPPAASEELAWQRDFQARLAAVPVAGLDRERAAERALLAAAVERDLLTLEVLRPRERDPSAWLPLVAGAIEDVLERGGMTPCAKARLVADRLAGVPEVLRAARVELRNPPRALTEDAIARFEGVLRFYRETVPEPTAECRNALLQADLAQADSTAVRAVQDFVHFLRDDLLPLSRGELAIGPEGCRRLLGNLLLDPVAPIDTLLAQGRSLLDQRRDTLESLAPMVAAGGLGEALAALASDRPPDLGQPADLARRLERLTAFVTERKLVRVTALTPPAVREARAFERPRGGLALESPGPWETQPTRAWLEVAPPDAADGSGSTPGGFTGGHDADLAVAHEGIPGRWVRAATLRGTTPRLRAALLADATGEAWGRYCETLLIEEGLWADDPRMRFAAALRALRHEGRSYAALGLHAGVLTLDQAAALLEERCLLEPAQAAREARSAAADPALMGYTWGARGLLELRDTARRALGPRFQIITFHDAVLRCGASPLGLVREEVRHALGFDQAGRPIGGP